VFYGSTKIINLNINIFKLNNNMTRLNLLFFAILISFIHNYYSEFNNIFLQSFFFLFLSELINLKLFNKFKRNQQNQDEQNNEDDSAVSDITAEKEDKLEEKEDKLEEKEDKLEEKEDKLEEKEDKLEEKEGKTEEEKVKEEEESSEETEEESDETEENSDESVDIIEGGDINQMEILRLLNNYDSLGDSGLMELKKKMLELDKLVEFYKNDTKKTKKE
jgi:hypothetical protein